MGPTPPCLRRAALRRIFNRRSVCVTLRCAGLAPTEAIPEWGPTRRVPSYWYSLSRRGVWLLKSLFVEHGHRGSMGWEEFGGAELGDERRRSRLVAMGAQAARVPAGKILEVFATSAARQGAYDFWKIERRRRPHHRRLAGACVERCADNVRLHCGGRDQLNLTERTVKGFRAYRS